MHTLEWPRVLRPQGIMPGRGIRSEVSNGCWSEQVSGYVAFHRFAIEGARMVSFELVSVECNIDCIEAVAARAGNDPGNAVQTDMHTQSRLGRRGDVNVTTYAFASHAVVPGSAVADQSEDYSVFPPANCRTAAHSGRWQNGVAANSVLKRENELTVLPYRTQSAFVAFGGALSGGSVRNAMRVDVGPVRPVDVVRPELWGGERRTMPAILCVAYDAPVSADS